MLPPQLLVLVLVLLQTAAHAASPPQPPRLWTDPIPPLEVRLPRSDIPASQKWFVLMNSLRSAAKPRPLSDEELRRRRAAAYDKKQQDLKILGKTN